MRSVISLLIPDEKGVSDNQTTRCSLLRVGGGGCTWTAGHKTNESLCI